MRKARFTEHQIVAVIIACVVSEYPKSGNRAGKGDTPAKRIDALTAYFRLLSRRYARSDRNEKRTPGLTDWSWRGRVSRARRYQTLSRGMGRPSPIGRALGTYPACGQSP